MTDTEKSYHHGNLRQALIEAGIAQLEEDGLEALSMRRIAARVGVSHTAPKNHFGSFRGLLSAIATEGFRRHAAHMQRGLSDDTDRKAQLNAAMRGYVQFALDHPALFRLMFSSTLCDHDDEDLKREASESYQVLIRISDGLQWDKAGAQGAQRKTESMLWSFVHGYTMLRIENQLMLDEIGDDITDILPDFGYRA
ncbi:MAG: TetR/AcrR family transcriptional regulator [Brevirhabdus sp.]